MFEKLDINDYSWTGLSLDSVQEFLSSKDFHNPLGQQLDIELENKGLREIFLMYDTKYLYYTVKILLNIELTPMQCAVLEQMFTHTFPMIIGSRGFSKSFLLAVYSLLRAILFPGSKIVLTSAAFRQSKLIYNYIETIFENSPVLQSIYKGKKPSARLPDLWIFYLRDSEIIAIPTGTGDKIRGIRANIVITDEFNSINTEIYEIVINQFTVVAKNPIEVVKDIARKKTLKAKGITEQIKSNSMFCANQNIISGTMRYIFEPMAIYWKKYKTIIESKGERLTEQFGEVGENFDWKDFCVIRIPYELIPEGFMDDKIVSRAKATMHLDFYQAEFGTVPISDSAGFFKRSLIESCTATNKSITKDGWPAWCSEVFDARISGNPIRQHVMGIDPAYNQDNFAIVILELFGEHARVVYTWSTSKKQFQADKQVDEKNYFNYCARKIRNLMKAFNCVGIAIDTQGGGYTILESLHDENKIERGEVPLWPVIDPDKEKDTDDRAGSHIITLCQFSDGLWTAQANHGMKKDMEDKVLLFPQFNSVLLGLASEKDKEDLLESISDDSLENCMMEIEELKNELSIIMKGTTPSGRERWDTPEIKLSTDRKDRMRKDRYSALLMANSIARTIQRAAPAMQYNVVGLGVGQNAPKKSTGKMYYGPEWYNNISPHLFRGINR